LQGEVSWRLFQWPRALIPDDPVGACFNPEAAGWTTKYTKHTKNDQIAKRTLLTCPLWTSAAPSFCQFVYFVYFVVPTAH
jgi:hypothetical protein